MTMIKQTKGFFMKWLKSILLIALVFTVFHVKMTAYAQDVAVAQPASVSVPSVGDRVVGELKAVDDKVPAAIPPWILGSLVFVIEAGARLYPSAKPKSLLLLVAAAFGLLGSIFGKLSSLLDGVVQNVKSE